MYVLLNLFLLHCTGIIVLLGGYRDDQQDRHGTIKQGASMEGVFVYQSCSGGTSQDCDPSFGGSITFVPGTLASPLGPSFEVPLSLPPPPLSPARSPPLAFIHMRARGRESASLSLHTFHPSAPLSFSLSMSLRTLSPPLFITSCATKTNAGKSRSLLFEATSDVRVLDATWPNVKNFK